MTRWKLRATVLVLAALGIAPAGAQPVGSPMGRMMREDGPAIMLRMVLKQANLTSDQQNKVHQIMDADHQQLRALFTRLQTANSQLAAKLFAPGTVQSADLAPQVQQITQLRQQLMEQGVKTALAIRAVLTPEQLARVAQVKDRVEKLQNEMRAIFEGTD